MQGLVVCAVSSGGYDGLQLLAKMPSIPPFFARRKLSMRMEATKGSHSLETFSRWPNVQAWILACAVFPLLWIGGMVTTYEAGMSVEDWPTTYGHWFYPIQKWIAGHWDMFLEHGHRTYAQVVGVLAVVAAWAIGWKYRGAGRWLLVFGLLAGIAVQAVLGGLRVLFDERLLAKIHACTAAAYFGFCSAVVVVTSRRWFLGAFDRIEEPTRARRWAWVASGLLYLDIVFGAQLRHSVGGESPGWFMLWLWLKLISAIASAVASGALAFGLIRPADSIRLARRAQWLFWGVLTQLILGAATWVVNYGVPLWFRDYVFPWSYSVTAEGGWQVQITTAHVAFGSLLFVLSLSIALWLYRAQAGDSEGCVRETNGANGARHTTTAG